MKHFINSFARPLTVVSLLVLAPTTYAQGLNASGACTATSIGPFLQYCVIDFIDKFVVPFIFALAFIVFIWGAYSYFIAGGANEEKRQEGQKFVMYAIIGFFLMFSIWGIIHLLLGTLNLENGTRPSFPTFNQSGSNAPKNTDTTSFPSAPANATPSPSGSTTIIPTCSGAATYDPTSNTCVNPTPVAPVTNPGPFITPPTTGPVFTPATQ